MVREGNPGKRPVSEGARVPPAELSELLAFTTGVGSLDTATVTDCCVCVARIDQCERERERIPLLDPGQNSAGVEILPTTGTQGTATDPSSRAVRWTGCGSHQRHFCHVAEWGPKFPPRKRAAPTPKAPHTDECDTPQLLDMASTIVRREVRQNFTRATRPVALRPNGGRVELPQRPVTSVQALRAGGQLVPAERCTGREVGARSGYLITRRGHPGMRWL